jgi:O-antigen/teichoic acid export membrane protein
MIALALPLVVGAFLISNDLILAFYGPTFLPAGKALWILVAAVSVLMIYAPANSLILSQQTKAATKIIGFTLLFNFTTNLIFIPRFGFAAAAVTTLASELIQAVCYSYVIKRKILSYQIFRSFIKPLVAAVVMAILVWQALPLAGIWLTVLLAAFVYGLALVLLKFFHREDVELFKSAVDIRKKLDPSIKPGVTL